MRSTVFSSKMSPFHNLGPASRNTRKLFGPVKLFFSSFVSKNGEVYAPETSHMKGTSHHIENM